MKRRKGMMDFVRELKKADELIVVKNEVSPHLEVTEITDRISKQPGGGKALLFTKTGTNFSILMNSLGSEERLTAAFYGRTASELSGELMQLVHMMTGPSEGVMNQIRKLPKLLKLARVLPKRKRGKGSCQHSIDTRPDLGKLPVLKCWPADGGSFITLPLVHTTDPNTGKRNVGMYRMQVLSPNETGMHWHMHKTGARHYREYQKLGKKMPMAVVLGGDPVYTYSATAPLPDGIDEYLLAGFIRNQPVRLVKCITQDVWVPEDADFVLEGYVDPAEELVLEGPFGDHTGFYSLADYYPRFHLTAITHRKDAVYPATIVGIPPQEDAWIAKATEELFLDPLKISMIPELIDFHLPIPGVAHNLGLFNIEAGFPGMGRKILSSVWGAGQMMFTKIGIVFEQSSNLRDYKNLAREVTARVNPLHDIVVVRGPLDVLDHAADVMGIGGKLGIDATGEAQYANHLEKSELDLAAQRLRSTNPDIIGLNVELVEDGISLASLTYRKNSVNQFKQLTDEILSVTPLNRIRFWILTDMSLPLMSWFELIWITGNNMDPSRDVHIRQNPEDKKQGVLFIDASRKSAQLDGFKRAWPNPVVMDKQTIDLVDKKWPEYELGPNIVSPSSRYLPLQNGAGAVVDDL